MISQTLTTLRSVDEELEAKLGDVLLFRPDADAAGRSHITEVMSRYTSRIYYTIETNADGSYTRIFRGAVHSTCKKADDQLVATISTARKHRLSWDFRWSTEPETLDEKRREYKTSYDTDSIFSRMKHWGSGSTLSAKTSLMVHDVDEHEKGATALSQDLSRDHSMLIVTYGKSAPAYVKDCLKMEKDSIVISMPDERWELGIDEANNPSMFAVEKKSGKRWQVAWGRATATRIVDGELQIVFPATLMFYPDVRKRLDAVIISLVAWQQNAHAAANP